MSGTVGDQSFKIRYLDALRGIEVFLRNPWVGAGPGMAKSDYFGSEFSISHQSSSSIRFETKPGPIANSTYIELVSEWGTLGLLSYFLGMFSMFSRLPRAVSFRVFALLAVVYLSLGSLARFDIWLFLSLIWAFFHSATPAKENNPDRA
ncbi:MAG: hypothetical protein JNM63_04520 [Spirochaetia bacterium]|nr:hypothetical protein [Spirochaetia bacterium]